MNYANNAFSVLNGSITNVATAITVATGTGSRFPASDFRVTLIGYDGSGNENAWEICHCTTRSGDVLTVTRGQESTTAVAWANATRIENRITAGTMNLLLPTTGGTVTGPVTVTSGAYTAFKVGLTGLVSVGGEAGSAEAKFTVTDAGNVGLEVSPTAIAGAIRLLSYNRASMAFSPMTLMASEHKLNVGGVDAVFVNASGNLFVGASGGARGGASTRGLFKLGAGQAYLELQANSTTQTDSGLLFSDGASGDYGAVGYDHSQDALLFYALSSVVGRFDFMGNLLVNTTARNASWGKQVRVADVDYPAFSIVSTRATNGREYTFCLNGTASGPSYLELWDQSNGRSILQISADDSTTTFRRGAFGYGSGAGGTVTQITSKATSVTLNKPNGIVYTHNAALGAGATAYFVLNNSFIGSFDNVTVNLYGAGVSAGLYRVFVDRVDAGLAVIVIQNYSGGSLSEVVAIKFAVIKGSAT